MRTQSLLVGTDRVARTESEGMGPTEPPDALGRTVERLIARRVRTSLDREVWTTRVKFWRLAWRELLGGASVPLATGLLILVQPFGTATARHIVAGALFASAFWQIYAITAMRTYNVTVGSWAEGWTREVLRQRSLGWTVEDDLFLGDANIDHVAVTQDEVLVVESKYRGYGKRPDLQRHQRDLEQAQRAAKRVRQDLARRGLELVRVVPVLVVWGPGGKDLPHFDAPEGTQVLAGQDLKRWCRQRSNKRLVSLTQRRAISQALSKRRREHDGWRMRQHV